MKINQLQNHQIPQRTRLHPGRPSSESFSEILKRRVSPEANSVRFSAHAADRLASRKISLTDHDMSKIAHAVEKIEGKGGKKSLVMMGDLSLVVSIHSRTVITAINNSSETGKVFTDIDSAVII